MEAKTYTNRNNARRAGVAAGVPAELVEITVHKNGDEVRFGWKQMEAPAPAAADAVVTTSKPKKVAAPKVERVEQNGVKRPKEGGLCAAVWAWLDANPTATIKDAKAAAPENGWNESNVACEFYAWRKFNGLSRATAA
ncbi:hypothetical protein [Pseudomonas aeruginosa]|uniref:hypothetical protein n=1 Tax=Pseudomonas aeruginosa TaxID=287 RepID=UPI000EABBCBA|nr:hypothetical protein [Pseudomonas aeruginosa]MBG4275771.1 hypothetical protein [Pseudomonas aeruginosa]QYE75212.1 hypothetical protein KZ795_18050 [Pseudomonas aeruginosa]